MTVMMRAVQANMEASDLQEKSMNRHIDRKEADNEKLKKMNKVLDRLSEMRSDNAFHIDERKELIEAAKNLGVELTMDDFTEINKGYEDVDSNGRNYRAVMLDPKRTGLEKDVAADKDESWGTARRDELDKVAQKIERAIKAAEDESGATSLHLNLAMNKYTQKLQDANGGVSAIKDLDSALTLRA
jgi:hypothetical protein